MSTPLSTPIRQAKLGISSTKSLPLANEYKKLLGEQYQRLWLKHQQDLDLIDDIRSYVKSRLSIERDYTQALAKLGKQHQSHITKRFSLLQQCDQQKDQPADHLNATGASASATAAAAAGRDGADQRAAQMLSEAEASDSRLQKRLANNGLDEPDKACTLYKVWSEHISRLQLSAKNRTEQFEQLTMVVDKLKQIRWHKAGIGKRCLDSHLKRVQEDILVSMVDVEKARKLYYEDESQAKKARENEEKIKKKRGGLLTKFTGGDLQAKKEKTSAQREANDIQSTQARNDYIMALAAANAHLQHYYLKDLADFMSLADDGVLDHCKIFMATLAECDINSLKDELHHAQYWSKMINLTGSQKTNSIFLDCEQSQCLRNATSLQFEPCNSDPISSISLEHNADYALQHEIDKWFTWFKKECRNLSQLIHQLERCQRALAEGQKSIELNGQTVEDLEPKIIELKQQIRKSEAAKLKAQARLKVIKEGGMQIEEWSVVESEIRADMARAQEELDSKRLRSEVTARRSSSSSDGGGAGAATDRTDAHTKDEGQQQQQVLLQISKNSDGSEMGDEQSLHNLASVSRSTSNLMDKQQKALSGYSALTDPSLVWQDDYSTGGGAWNAAPPSPQPVDIKSPANKDLEEQQDQHQQQQKQQSSRYNHLETSSGQPASTGVGGNTVQSSSPLSAIVDGNHGGLSTSPYQTMMGEAYKSDYECDYNRTTGQMQINSAASSVEPYGIHQYGSNNQNGTNRDLSTDRAAISEQEDSEQQTVIGDDQQQEQQQQDVSAMLGQQVVAQYTFDKTNEDDLSFVEGDILRVLEVCDSNWLQARNEATGEQGFIPAPYVRLLSASGEPLTCADNDTREDSNNNNRQRDSSFIKYESYVDDPSMMNEELEDQFFEQQADSLRQEEEEEASATVYCRALYDYQPEAGTCDEADGLPHLALAQGELLRVLDQGEEDGWWLVEKQLDGGNTCRGHVPSMLVEELEEGQEEADEDENDGEASECSDYPDLGAPPPPMPNMEPPKLDDQSPDQQQQQQDYQMDDVEASQQSMGEDTTIPTPPTQSNQPQAPPPPPPTTAAATTITNEQQSSSSLVPTSFIIIEPTPEVESKSIISKQPAQPEAGQTGSAPNQDSDSPTQKAYSIINEDFVLEGPSRKPSQLSHQQLADETTTTNNNNNNSNTNNSANNYEPLSECDDSSDIPAPPSVLIECFEVERHDSSRSSSAAGEEATEQPEVTNPTREIKHTGNVDVNPILRLRAEEFTKQIIAEAITMTQNVSASSNSDGNGRRISEKESLYYDHHHYNGRDLELEDEEEEGGNDDDLP